jgi:hypothetical protein
MKKLSKTQIKCIERMKKDIDTARECKTFREYIIKTNVFVKGRIERDPNYLEENIEYFKERYEKYYEEHKKGNVLVSGYGKPTLNALEKMGIVTVIEYEENRRQGVIDWVHLNDY